MASKSDPPTQTSMVKALNVIHRDQNRRDLTPSSTVPHPKAVMVWMGISTNGATKPRLYPNGDAVFHQDSAPSHASRVTQKFLTDQQVQFLRHNNGCQTVLTLQHVTIFYRDI
ncbi:hypothetical protein AVEN_131970-1 [Araneus ventricosus]|uniref:Tc1-like transposase DDE domain-containing protein n=1 Tax=Araneus ventricosus TaxID=182803 RepID=A0A4Y2B331_ARAVE|nr:hypothetical protein AVEN_131970-1 [Araneus ventricosus]